MPTFNVVRALSRVLGRAPSPVAQCFAATRRRLEDAYTLEVGGPSPIFERSGLFPIYRRLHQVDTCTLARDMGQVRWGAIMSPRPLSTAGRHPGNYIAVDGPAVPMIRTKHYDAVLSSHTLDVIANPLLALAEWRRVLTPSGTLVLVLPHRDGTADHRRPVTTLAHLIADQDATVGEDDQTHLPEILALVRASRVAETRTIRHHVFDTPLAVAMVETAGFGVEHVEPMAPCHILIVARREAMAPREWSSVYRASPFPSDRVQG